MHKQFNFKRSCVNIFKIQENKLFVSSETNKKRIDIF